MGFFDGNVQANIEDAIINTFFESELMGVKHTQLFKLDDRNFQTNFKRRIAQMINERLATGGSISLLAHEIVEKCVGNYEREMIFILAQNPLPIQIARDYHAYLSKKRIERELNGIA